MLGPKEGAQLQQVTDLVRTVLGPQALGVWLYGSAVAGGLKPASDLDVLVVTSRATDAAQRRGLIDGLLALSGPRATLGPGRSAELTVVVQSAVRPWRYPPALDFQYGDWLRDDFAHGNDAPWATPNPDLAVLLSMVLGDAVTLFGPPPATLIDHVPRADLVRAMRDSLPSLLADLETDTGNVLLTLVRIWRTLATGSFQSKDAAAEWALERLPEEHRPVIAHARDNYLAGRHDWPGLAPRAQACAKHLVRVIASVPVKMST